MSEAPPQVLLEAEGLGREFHAGSGEIVVLRDLDFTLRAGECVAVLGQSGAGKSTLLHLFGALDRPSRGVVRFGGEDVFSKPPEALAHFRNTRLGFVFQFHHLLPEFSAEENVMMPGLLGGGSFDALRVRARAILEEVGLSGRLEHPVGKLSGGERQRVAVARALLLSPPLLLADEPTGNLDQENGARVGELLLEQSRAKGAALVIATHNLELARRMERILVLRDGRLHPHS